MRPKVLTGRGASTPGMDKPPGRTLHGGEAQGQAAPRHGMDPVAGAITAAEITKGADTEKQGALPPLGQ
jgi:hypothetical protein